jgi:cysteinyl-tRNA synthetase
MSTTHLDDTIDIHVGGQDLVFPHHENEIAQSEAATGQTFARYWMHVRLLETKDEKMSSSLGNFETVAGFVAEHGANVARTFLLSTAYHNSAVYSEQTVAEAVERWETLQRGYERAVEACDSADAYTDAEDDVLRAAVAETRESFTVAMNDDFNTREALTALTELVAAVNRHVDGHDRYDFVGLRRSIETLEELAGGVLGLSFGGETDGDVRLAQELADLVLEIREDEREAGNYDRADDLRDALEALDIDIEDTDDGPVARF